MNTFPKDLIDSLASGEAVAVVGSGLSLTAGLPSWPQLLEAMIKECDEHIVGFSDSSELRQMLSHGEFLAVADECVKRLGKPLYRDFLQRIFKNPSARPTETHRLLLDLPFSAILTTNYDTLLEQSLGKSKTNTSFAPVYTHKNNAELERLAGNKSFFILKLHGHIDDIETVVLTYQNYRDIYRNESYRRTLSTLLATRRLVFLGYGLRDPDLNYLLEEQNSIYKNFGQRHFAFVADPGKVLSEYFSDRFNIEVLPYNSNRRHLQLQNLLQALGKIVRQEKRSRKVVKIQRKIELPLTTLRAIREIMSYEQELCEAFGGKIEASRARFLKANARKAGFAADDIELIEKSLDKLDTQTALKEEKIQASHAADAFAAFAKSNPNPIFQIMPDGNVHFYNEAAAQLLKESGHNNIEQLLPDTYLSVVLRCIQEPNTRQKLEATFNNRKLAWWFFSDPDDKFVHCYAEDITDRLQLEEQLRQAQKMETVGQLAGGIAHDFNNILTVIQGYALLLRDYTELKEEGLTSVTEISRATERAMSLVRQLLVFSRRSAVQARELDLNKVISSLSKMLRRVVSEDVHLELELKDIPNVLVDERMLEQSLLNLVINARDAMPRGGQLIIQTRFVQITNPADSESRPGDFAVLSVVDTGCGIPREIIPRIFEPFFTTKEVGKGTGLGLATVYGIVKQHNGWMTVESEVGKGSTFRIFLPASQSVATQEANIDPALLKGRGETILLVEDESAVAAFASSVLNRSGYEVIVATDGVNALTHWQVKKDKIALLFTDMVMPAGISGHDLAERLISDKPSLRVVYTTGYSVEVMGLQTSMREGVNLLLKPYTPTALLRVIRVALGKD